MKVIYMGTPDFAVPALEALVDDGQQVGYVITKPDAARDRGKKISFSPVKEKAMELGIPVLQPDKVKGNKTLIEKIKAYGPDIIAVAAYGKVLPKDILKIPVYGCVNIHASLLPRFRGAAPIQQAILQGDSETGVTTMMMEEGLDTGDILMQKKTVIDGKNSQKLHDELAGMGAEMLLQTIKGLRDKRLEPKCQDEALSTYAPMISKKDGKIDFTCGPEEIERKIRAFDPWPGAFTFYKGKQIKFWKAEVSDEKSYEKPGTITKISENGIVIATGGNGVIVTVLQLPGKKRTEVKDFLRGNTIEKGIVLG